MTLQAPNIDPAHGGQMGGITRDVLVRWLRDSVDGMLPARVLSYDPLTNRARIRPVIRVGLTDGGSQPRAEVASVPTLRIGGGGFFLAVPVKAGDEGWIMAGDRDVSAFLQSGGDHPPPSRRMHSFSQGLFIPDSLRNTATVDPDALALQSLDGESAVILRPDEILVQFGPVSIRVAADGVAITSPALTHNGVNIGATHVHGGVTAGGASTGEPT